MGNMITKKKNGFAFGGLPLPMPLPAASIRVVAAVELKGQCHEMDILFKGLNNITSTFCVCADRFPQNFLLCDWSMFSSADFSWAAGKMREN
jgi:hypothetical protein